MKKRHGEVEANEELSTEERIEALTKMLDKSVSQNEQLAQKIGSLEETNAKLLNQIESNMPKPEDERDTALQAYLNLFNEACGYTVTLDELKQRLEV